MLVFECALPGHVLLVLVRVLLSCHVCLCLFLGKVGEASLLLPERQAMERFAEGGATGFAQAGGFFAALVLSARSWLFVWGDTTVGVGGMRMAFHVKASVLLRVCGCNVLLIGGVCGVVFWFRLAAALGVGVASLSFTPRICSVIPCCLACVLVRFSCRQVVSISLRDCTFCAPLHLLSQVLMDAVRLSWRCCFVW